MNEHRINGFFASLIGIILIATGITAIWVLFSSGVFNPLPQGLSAPTGPGVEAAPAEVLTGPVRLTNSFQISQPRDPFRPLITPDSPVTDVPGVGGGTTTTTTTAPGTGNGDNGNGFTPDTNTITLIAVRDVSGTLRATIEVNGTEYEVGVGETFAVSYKVVSLSATGGVFSFGDTVFELDVGQMILK